MTCPICNLRPAMPSSDECWPCRKADLAAKAEAAPMPCKYGGCTKLAAPGRKECLPHKHRSQYMRRKLRHAAS